ncbi:MAG TPA: hypothetical protein VKD72_20730 [Gemmataceae bacterium]|nr:hypothetical protein [Gemmataceae bacterium]
MKLFLRACPLLVALALAGCSGSSVRLVPVQGRATLGNKALARVTIQLVPDASKGTHAPAGAGQTDENGAFRITTPPHGEGAVPGFYRVMVTAYVGQGVPPSYSDPSKTPLRVEIPPSGLENWELKLRGP